MIFCDKFSKLYELTILIVLFIKPNTFFKIKCLIYLLQVINLIYVFFYVTVSLDQTSFGYEPIARANDGSIDQQMLIILDDEQMALPLDGIISEWSIYLSVPGTVKILLWQRTVDLSQFKFVSMVTLDLPGNTEGLRTLKSSDFFTPYGTKKGDIMGFWFEGGAGISFDNASDCNDGEGRMYVVNNVRPEDLIIERTYTATKQSHNMACRNYSVETTVIKREYCKLGYH